ncbi:hypothetical protein BT93_L4346 [Corymbia citriodora subsp. variegata]|uniref:TF-B3 domain-containing protein n=1 Tax=Corymbia citriodora subsp. variegata TaxID=360336 RepID=A0A8T0CUE8_CORYI|nr:hypothetical protein BT93_L4346 [Corymbia citriodora subsp. variegata]
MYRFLAPLDSFKPTSVSNVSRQPIMGHPQKPLLSPFERPPTQIIHAPTQPTPSFQWLPFPCPYPYPPHYLPRPFCFWQNHNGTQLVRFESPSFGPTAFDLAGLEQKVLDARVTKLPETGERWLAKGALICTGGALRLRLLRTQAHRAMGKHPMDDQTLENNGREDRHSFFMPDGKRLRMLLKKELKNSDVRSLGRIVLPKREAEENLPIVPDKEGIQLVIRDVSSPHEWTLRYRYWSNNNSRMYLFENAGELVKQNGLDIGDSITFYEDECKKIYFSIEKVARTEEHPCNKRHKAIEDLDLNNSIAPISNEPRAAKGGEEEEAAPALLTGQFKHGEGDSQALAADFSKDSSVPCRDYLYAAGEGTSKRPYASTGDDQQIDFDGFYRGLETLTNMDPHTYSLLDPCWIGNSGAT